MTTKGLDIPKAVGKTRKRSTKRQVATPTHEEIARLAEEFWAARGRPEGSPEEDWIRAEEELRGKAS